LVKQLKLRLSIILVFLGIGSRDFQSRKRNKAIAIEDQHSQNHMTMPYLSFASAGIVFSGKGLLLGVYNV